MEPNKMEALEALGLALIVGIMSLSIFLAFVFLVVKVIKLAIM